MKEFIQDSYFQLKYVFKGSLRKARSIEPLFIFFVISSLVVVNTCLLYSVVCVFALFSGVKNINPKATIFFNGVYTS